MKPTPDTDPHKHDPIDLPEAGIKKTNPKELDRKLDKELEQSMDASDPPSVTMPEVKIRDKSKPH